jgi:hypothetical protein
MRSDVGIIITCLSFEVIGRSDVAKARTPRVAGTAKDRENDRCIEYIIDSSGEVYRYLHDTSIPTMATTVEHKFKVAKCAWSWKWFAPWYRLMPRPCTVYCVVLSFGRTVDFHNVDRFKSCNNETIFFCFYKLTAQNWKCNIIWVPI